MTTRQFNKALDELGLGPASLKTATALGVGRRHVQRMASGERAVQLPVQLLIELYLKRPKLIDEVCS